VQHNEFLGRRETRYVAKNNGGYASKRQYLAPSLVAQHREASKRKTKEGRIRSKKTATNLKNPTSLT
jgi:hypothetical protein